MTAKSLKIQQPDLRPKDKQRSMKTKFPKACEKVSDLLYE